MGPGHRWWAGGRPREWQREMMHGVLARDFVRGDRRSWQLLVHGVLTPRAPRQRWAAWWEMVHGVLSRFLVRGAPRSQPRLVHGALIRLLRGCCGHRGGMVHGIRSQLSLCERDWQRRGQGSTVGHGRYPRQRNASPVHATGWSRKGPRWLGDAGQGQWRLRQLIFSARSQFKGAWYNTKCPHH